MAEHQNGSPATMKSNFELPNAQKPHPVMEGEYRARALEAICGSMVFVEGTPLYWDILDEQ